MLQEEFEAFIITHQEAFYRFAFTYVKSNEATLDVVQESILKGLEKLHTLKEPKHMKTWFYRILVNTSISYIRKNKRYISLESYPEFAQYETMSHSEKIDLYESIQRLDTRFKTVIILRYFEDMKISDIARIIGRPESTVKSRIKRGLEKLGEMI